MSNNLSDYPRHKRASGKPLFDTGNLEGYQEIAVAGKKVGSGLVVLIAALKRLFKRKKKAEAPAAE